MKSENVSIENVLKAISDNKAMAIFNSIALADINGKEIQTRVGLTTKQYYSRVSAFVETGLVARKNSRYSLTLLGRIVYEAHITVCKALRHHWKLKMLDSIRMSATSDVPEEEFSKLIDTLIDDYKIRNMVARELTRPQGRNKYSMQYDGDQQIKMPSTEAKGV